MAIINFMPEPSKYSIKNYKNDSISNLFNKDVFEQFGQELDEEEFWSEYWSNIDPIDHEIAVEMYRNKLSDIINSVEIQDEWGQYYDNMINSELDKENEIELPEDLDITPEEIYSTRDKYYQYYPNDDILNKDNFNNKNFTYKDQVILIRLYESQKRALQKKLERESVKNTIKINNVNQLTKEIADYFMDLFGMFYDPNKNRLFINNYMGGYGEFIINAKTNWLDFLNKRMYTEKIIKVKDDDGQMYDKVLQLPCTTTRKTLENSLSNYVTEIKTPLYSKVGFKNQVLDTTTYETTSTGTNPIYTKLTIPYKYNPNAEGGELKSWLEYELGEEGMNGLLEYIGYVIVEPGHTKHQWMLFIFGIGGAGKSMLLRFISKALGEHNCCTISLPKILNNNRFEYSSIINKTLARIEEVDGNKVDNFAFFKEHTSGSPLSVEEKNKPQVTIPSSDVAKLIAVGNKPIAPESMDKSFLRRVLLLEFLKKPTQEMLEDVNFENRILENTEYMEWLIYQSIQAYRRMIDNCTIPMLKLSDKKLLDKLKKHAYSENEIVFNYFINTDDNDSYLTKDLFRELTDILSIKDGLDVKGERSKVWRDSIFDLTGDKRNFDRMRRNINGKQRAIWKSILPNESIKEEYLAYCPNCDELTIKGKPCIYCGKTDLQDIDKNQNI
jgi:phage/plasmid-associated DNA primase